jgi:hypothetical protein
MDMLEVTARLRDAEVVAGCALVVEIVLASTAGGKTLVEVHAEGSDVPFEHELRGADGTRYVVSKARFEGRLNPHPNPAPEPVRQPLVPGESVRFTDDVAAWMLGPIEAGTYTLVVHYKALDGTDLAAAPLEVKVVAPEPTAVATAVDGSGQYATTAFAHGGTTLFERRSAYGNPELGRGIVRHRAASRIEAVAVATEIDGAVDWRAIGWIEGGCVRAALTWGDEVLSVLDAGPHGLVEAMLVPQGWQTMDGSCLFVAVGSRGGRGACSLVLFPKGAPPEPHLFDLASPAPLAAAVGHLAGARGELELVRADVSGGQVVIGAQRIELARRGAAGPVRALAQASGPLRALAVAPLVLPTSQAEAVVGDAFLRAPLAGGAPQAWPLAPKPGASVWSIPTTPHPDAPVLAQEDSELFLAHAAHGPDWTRIAKSKTAILHPRALHMTVPDGSVARTPASAWFDAAWGYAVKVEPES